MRKTNVARNGGSSKDGAGTNGQTVHNKILLGLPQREAALVFPRLEFQELPINTILHDVAQPIKFAYFINAGLASIVNVMSDGKSVEMGLTGKEGFTGTPILAGLRSSSTRAIIQITGSGLPPKGSPAC